MSLCLKKKKTSKISHRKRNKEQANFIFKWNYSPYRHSHNTRTNGIKRVNRNSNYIVTSIQTCGGPGVFLKYSCGCPDPSFVQILKRLI